MIPSTSVLYLLAEICSDRTFAPIKSGNSGAKLFYQIGGMGTSSNNICAHMMYPPIARAGTSLTKRYS